MKEKLHEIATFLRQDGGRMSNKPDPFRAIIFVEGIGMFISRDWAYGTVDLDMEKLQQQYPGAIVYKIGVAEFIPSV